MPDSAKSRQRKKIVHPGNPIFDSSLITRYLLAILLVGLAIRTADLFIASHFSQSDELFSIEAAMQPSASETIRYVARDTHPPFYFLFLRQWMMVTSENLVSAKIVSVLMNLANILLTYHFSRLWVSRRTALVAAVIMALSPWNIYWSHLARNHQMLPPLFTISSFSLFLWLESERKKHLVYYFLSTVLMIQTNYLAFFILPVHCLIALNKSRKKLRVFLAILIAQEAALFSYLPYLETLARQVHIGQMNAGFFQQTVSTGWLFFHFFFFNIFTGKLGDLWYAPPSGWGIIIAGGLVIAILIVLALREIRDPCFYILLFLPPIITLTYARLKGTTMAERYLAYMIGPFAICMASGINVIMKQISRGEHHFSDIKGSNPVQG